VPVYAEKTEVRENWIDARVVDKQKKKVLLLHKLPVDGKQETEGRRENLEVCTAQMGDVSAVPTL